jgi:hypothetical protein
LVANNITPLPGDRSVSADEIDIETSATANTVSLTATIAPPISISGVNTVTGPDDTPVVLPSLFNFLLNFDISISGSSSRQITGVSLVGDVFATGDALSRVVFDLGTSTLSNPDLEIFEDGLFPPPQVSDSISLSARKLVFLEGLVEGLTSDGATAGLSTFTLTFNLQGTAPPDPAVIPLPAGLPLLLAGVGALALVRRRKT